MMNNRHLPAGQQIMPQDMRGRRQYAQNQNHNHGGQPYPHVPPATMMPGAAYNMNPYYANATPNYYDGYRPQAPPPPQYHNPYAYGQGMSIYATPPSYPPPRHPNFNDQLPRPQQSPAVVSTPYQPPPVSSVPPAPRTPQAQYVPQATPTSQVRQIPQGPQTPQPLSLDLAEAPTAHVDSNHLTRQALQAPSNPQTLPPLDTTEVPVSKVVPGQLSPATSQRTPSLPPSSPIEAAVKPRYQAPLPWVSDPDFVFPIRRSRARRRRSKQPVPVEDVQLPAHSAEAITNNAAEPTGQPPARAETPNSPLPISEHEQPSTNPPTPSSQKPSVLSVAVNATPALAVKPTNPTSVSPIVPVLPKPGPKQETAPTSTDETTEDQKPLISSTAAVTPPAPKAWVVPKVWSSVLTKNPAPTSPAIKNGNVAADNPTVGKSNAELLADTLSSFNALSTDSKIAFLEPRGLVNTGNMCYMNSVLQVLVFCSPFFNFLDQFGKRAIHSFNSDTPLIDAMIMFKSEYKIIDSALSVEKLRLRLKDGELEQYGQPLTPDFVYDAMKRLPRFVSMQRGHQQDAEEFLGFLLGVLHEECVHIMRSNPSKNNSAVGTPANGPASPTSEAGSIAGSTNGKENGWHEVGPKQRAATTRSSGTIETETPITMIFGGKFRSELKVPGQMDSITLEPYQPLQLDIGSAEVHNIVDALKLITRQEAVHGDFKSSKGPNVAATKQVFIEQLPPVLILHLKRFQYDNTGGTQKIWKKVGYPLELEIPKELFTRQRRAAIAHGGLPKYRLMAVVYHHGKNASGGHYTVDVRRQDGREWIRLDDKEIRRIRSEDVAEGGSEEDPKVLAAALDSHKKDSAASGNAFAAIEDGEEITESNEWKQASGAGKKWSSVANGTTTPKSKAESKFSVKDAKVAYLLFYQKI